MTYFLAATETITVAPGSAWSKVSAKIARSSGPAATIQVAAGSSVFAPVTKACPRQDAGKNTAGRGHGWPGGREVAGIGTEQTRFQSGKQVLESVCDAKCDAFSTDRIDVPTRTVILVAGMRIPEAAREAVLARLTADRASQNGSHTER